MNKNKNELTKDDLARLLFENNFRSLYKVIQYRQKQILIGSSMAVYLILKSWMIFTPKAANFGKNQKNNSGRFMDNILSRTLLL